MGTSVFHPLPAFLLAASTWTAAASKEAGSSSSEQFLVVNGLSWKVDLECWVTNKKD